MKPEEYLCIAFWGEQLCSYPYYIKRQQQEAAEECAPVDAIYRDLEGWATLDQVRNRQVIRAAMEAGLGHYLSNQQILSIAE